MSKISIFWIVLGFVLTTFFTSCKNLPVEEVILPTPSMHHPSPPRGYEPARVHLMSQKGDNSMGVFSPDGQRILFLSKNRVRHKNSQIYEFSLQTKTEKRISFHDGEDNSPSYDRGGRQIIYSSTTDEIKESPQFIQNNLIKPKRREKTPASDISKDLKSLFWNHPSEIYTSLRDGNSIRRRSHHPGFDGHPSYHPFGKTIVFSSQTGDSLNLYDLTIRGGKLRQLTFGKTLDIEPSYSPNGKSLAWIRVSPDRRSSQLIVGDRLARSPKILMNTGFSRSPRWALSGKKIIFASNLDDQNNYEIYVIHLATGCLERLTYNLFHDVSPSLSPSSGQVLFTSNRSGKNRLYIMKYLPPRTCESRVL